MRWKYETSTKREERIGKWHKWFAWHPVDDGKGNRFWLENVQRRIECHSSYLYYWETSYYKRLK